MWCDAYTFTPSDIEPGRVSPASVFAFVFATDGKTQAREARRTSNAKAPTTTATTSKPISECESSFELPPRIRLLWTWLSWVPASLAIQS